MAVLVKTLVAPKQMEATQTTQYTAVTCRAIIDKATVASNATSLTLRISGREIT